MTTRTYEYFYKLALVAKQQLEQVGFNVELKVVDWATLASERANPDLYDVFSTGFIVSPDPYFSVYIQESWHGWWKNAQKDELVRQLATEVSPEKRKAAWEEIQRLAYEEDMPIVKFGDYFPIFAIRNEVKGYQHSVYRAFWNTWVE